MEKRKQTPDLLLIGILAFGLFVRLWRLGERGFPREEVIELLHARSSTWLKALPDSSTDLFGYFWSHLLWRFGVGHQNLELWSRLPAALAGTATLLLLWAVGRRMAGRIGGWAAAALTAPALLHIQVSQSFRSHAYMGFFLCLLTWGGLRYAKDRDRWGGLAILVGIGGAGLSHVSAALFLVVWGLWLMAWPWWSGVEKGQRLGQSARTLTWVVPGGLIAMLQAIVMVMFSRLHNLLLDVMPEHARQPGLDLDPLLRTLHAGAGGTTWGAILLGLLVLAGLWFCWRRREWSLLGLALLAGLLNAALYMALYASGTVPMIRVEQLFPVLIPVYLLAARGAAGLCALAPLPGPALAALALLPGLLIHVPHLVRFLPGQEHPLEEHGMRNLAQAPPKADLWVTAYDWTFLAFSHYMKPHLDGARIAVPGEIDPSRPVWQIYFHGRLEEDFAGLTRDRVSSLAAMARDEPGWTGSVAIVFTDYPMFCGRTESSRLACFFQDGFPDFERGQVPLHLLPEGFEYHSYGRAHLLTGTITTPLADWLEKNSDLISFLSPAPYLRHATD